VPDLFVKRHARRSEDPSSSGALVSAGHAAMKVRLSAASESEAARLTWSEGIGCGVGVPRESQVRRPLVDRSAPLVRLQRSALFLAVRLCRPSPRSNWARRVRASQASYRSSLHPRSTVRMR
jgi:hypothetical protein